MDDTSVTKSEFENQIKRLDDRFTSLEVKLEALCKAFDVNTTISSSSNEPLQVYMEGSRLDQPPEIETNRIAKSSQRIAVKKTEIVDAEGKLFFVSEHLT